MLSLSEIRRRAIAFAQSWKDEESEHAEAQTFWGEFFTVFGLVRKRVATFEHAVQKAGERAGRIDMFWPGVCVVEHKSAGRDLDRAFTQALDYFPGLTDVQLPRYVIVSDFQRIRLHDLVDSTQTEFALADLPENTHHFGFISGYVQRKFRDEDPANVRAAELMGQLHDALKHNGYDGHPLEVFLVRILFCLFADDTGIFERDSFVSFLETKTREDGLGFGSQLIELFQILNTDKALRPRNLDEELAAFPYVNGSLFSEPLPVPTFDTVTRERLLKCAYFNWQNVSPAVFGAMFQSVMDDVERRNLGAHYTSEKNILKVVSGLFMDELHEDFERAKDNAGKLRILHERMANMRFLDPASGCGNFLVVTYKELRLLEIEILKRIEELGKGPGKGQLVTDVSELSKLSVHSMNGIEIEEFPARIAEVALWLVDHQMNVRMAEEFGTWWVRLPLSEGPTIHNTDALELDWKPIIASEADKEWFILGNPPFIGSKMMTEAQRSQIKRLFGNGPGAGVLDYVTGWYAKTAALIQDTRIKCAFVSTNSISQGEQVGVLWKFLIQQYGMHIHFAHRTFKWSSEARGAAAVHCVIVGFGYEDCTVKYLFDYPESSSSSNRIIVRALNGYLVEGPDFFVSPRETPICAVPRIATGNKPIDGGHYLFTDTEKIDFVKQEPSSEGLFRRWYGAAEYINDSPRWCLYLKDVSPSTLRSMPTVVERIRLVQAYRKASDSAPTQKLSATPTRFHVENAPAKPYLVVPQVSSIRRMYIPIGWFDPAWLASDKLRIVENATLFHFAILQSAMHMAWVRQVSGRLKSDYMYANSIAYNAFPWPMDLDEHKKLGCEKSASYVLEVRRHHVGSNLADLYDPITMPDDLRKAHVDLDRTVDACYRKEPFKSERERVEHLFGLYRKLTEGFGAEVPAKRSRKQKA